jgi:hypothetical protein
MYPSIKQAWLRHHYQQSSVPVSLIGQAGKSQCTLWKGALKMQCTFLHSKPTSCAQADCVHLTQLQRTKQVRVNETKCGAEQGAWNKQALALQS